GEPDQDGQVESPVLEVVHQLLEVDARSAVAARPDLDVPGAVDGDESRAPGVNVVELERILDRPSRHRSSGITTSGRRCYPRAGITPASSRARGVGGAAAVARSLVVV